MTDKELQKLKRPELLEIMLGLQNELDKAKEENEVLRAKLNERNIALEKSGSIAEAALEINGVFDAAQKAADVYLENIRKMHSDEEKHHADAIAKSEKEAENIRSNAKREADTLKTKTDIECRTKIKNTDEECARKIKTTDEECNQKIKTTDEDCTRKINETNSLCTQKIRETQEKCTAISSLDNQIASFFGSGNKQSEPTPNIPPVNTI